MDDLLNGLGELIMMIFDPIVLLWILTFVVGIIVGAVIW